MKAFFRFVGWTFVVLVFVTVEFSIYSGPTGNVGAVRAERNIIFTSDPSGASIYFDDYHSQYTTPAEVKLSSGLHSYRVTLESHEDEFNLYKPYQGELNVTKDDGVSVWLNRRSPEEIAELEAKDRARAEAAFAELEAKMEAERVYYRIETNCASGANLTYMNADGNITQQNNMGNGLVLLFRT